MMCDSIFASLEGKEHCDQYQYLPRWYLANPMAVGFLSKRLSLVKPGRVLRYTDDAGGSLSFLLWKLCV